ncbi:SUN domain-containing protein 1 isoform X2 [Denticeps clupeoides]|uniref:SUN domain-containing protein n=3 Tax=Denticeps clupeoides TaxID=299321 RepID=A0AAY4CLM8_9TELE|nr:SUN domain-containing protein 1 isoform X2 [Denticeps clupeoides]
MNMDFSHLHAYSPPQCCPDNTGYTYSLSSSYSSAALEFEREHRIAPVFDSPRMSRRSLRLHTTGGLYGNDQSRGQSYSSSSSAKRTVRSRRQQQPSPADALTQTPVRRSLRGHGVLLSGADAVTTTDSAAPRPGLEGDCAARSSSRLNGDASATQAHAAPLNGYICKDCSHHARRDDPVLLSLSSSSSRSDSGAAAGLHLSPPSSSSTTSTSSSSYSSIIYSRDSSRRVRRGVLFSVSDACVRQGRRVLSAVCAVVTMLQHGLLWSSGGDRHVGGKGDQVSGSEVFWRLRSAGVSRVSWLWQKLFYRQEDVQRKAHSSFCGSMNVRDEMNADECLSVNGALCDDCKGSRHPDKHTPHTPHSHRRALSGVLWAFVTYAGASVLQTCRSAATVGGAITTKAASILWSAVLSPGKAVRSVLWLLGTGWYQLVTLLSLLNVFILTRCLPRILKLLLLLLPLLLLLALWFWGSSGLLALLPAANLTRWSSETLSVLLPTSSTPQPAPASTRQSDGAAAAAAALDVERLSRVEERLAELWRSVQQGEARQQQRHGETMGLYHTLRQQLDADKHTLDPWVSGLVEDKLRVLRGDLERLTNRRAEARQQELEVEHKSHEARLAEMELLLQALTTETEALQQKQKEETTAVPPVPESAGVGQEDHDALLGQVRRLEAELGHIRAELQGLLGCRGRCEQLDGLHEKVSAQVSAQVRRELETLFYGSEGAGQLPDSFLRWMSTRFVRGDDLRASLASLEQSILGNVSLQLELNKPAAYAETVHQTVSHTAQTAGMSEEQVHVIVRNALKLYSQDRTGQVDYALESGGGSILSTRCSETFETKTALMSLFGVPLWYFSQSPRVVIQPDVYPGNCWAFKGSQGYLVIRLSLRVRPTSFCLEHIPKSLSPTGSISSAPRRFAVYGLDDEYQEEGSLLGDYTYQEDGESLQIFPVTEPNERTYQIIEMRVLSNWGHPEYTCLYRFRVHGQPLAQ